MNLYKIYFNNCWEVNERTIDKISNYVPYSNCNNENIIDALNSCGYCYYKENGKPFNGSYVIIDLYNYDKFNLRPDRHYPYYANYIIQSERDKKLNQLI